jgi:hypothetical protein
MVDWSGNIHVKRIRTNQLMRLACWRLLIRCGVHTMSFALGTGVKLGDAINHLTLIVVSFGRCVVFGAKVGYPLGLVVY